MPPSGKPVYKRSPSIVVYMDDPVSPTFVRAEDNTNRSRSIGVSDPTNSTAVETLLAAIAARLTTIGGGQVKFPSGTLPLKSFPAFPAKTTIIGEGTENTIFTMPVVALDWTLPANFRIEHIKFVGTQDLQTRIKPGDYNIFNDICIDGGGGVSGAINIENRTGVRLYDLNIKNQINVAKGYAAALHATGTTTDLRIDGFNIYNCDRGVEMENGASNVWVTRGLIDTVPAVGSSPLYSIGAHGHEAEGYAQNIHYKDIRIVNSDGFTATSECENVTFDNIEMISPTGYSLIGGASNHIRNCHFDGAGSGAASDLLIAYGGDIAHTMFKNIEGYWAIKVPSGATIASVHHCNFIPSVAVVPRYGIRVEGGLAMLDQNIFSGTYDNYAWNVKNTGAIRAFGNLLDVNKAMLIEATASACHIINNRLPVSPAFALIYNTGNTISGNSGYLARGEIRTLQGNIATLTENAYNSVDNPFGQNVALLSLDIYVATAATATSPNIDCGIGSSATTDYTTLFDDLPGETIGIYNSKIATPGTQTQPILWQTGAGNRYLNMSIKDAAATGMVATYVATVMGL